MLSRVCAHTPLPSTRRALAPASLLSFGTAALPAEVLPTGLECLGPRPGIFSPLDFSMSVLQ